MNLIEDLFRRRIKAAGRVLIFGRPLPRTDVPQISDEELQQIKRFFPMPKFFIFGHARSGTTLLGRLLRLHPEVHCNWQGHFFTRPPLITSLVKDHEVMTWLARRSNRWNLGVDPAALMLRASIDILMERDAFRNGKHIVGDKSPSSLFDEESVRMAWCLYPDASVIVIIRDGRDTIISHLLQTYMDSEHVLKWREKRIRNSFQRNPFPFYEGRQSLFTSGDLRNRAKGWVRNVRETERAGRELFGNKYLQIRYEDLLSRPTEIIKRTWDFLEAHPATPELVGELEREVHYNPDAPRQLELLPALEHSQFKGGPGIWRELMTEYDRTVFKEIAGQTLIDYGYEKDLDW